MTVQSYQLPLAPPSDEPPPRSLDDESLPLSDAVAVLGVPIVLG